MYTALSIIFRKGSAVDIEDVELYRCNSGAYFFKGLSKNSASERIVKIK
jgi:hypothetical protein